MHEGKKEVCCCSGSRKQTHHEILPVRTREHISCGERPPGDVCNERGHVVRPGHYPMKEDMLFILDTTPLILSKCKEV
eukprot:303471-Pelagomonas_calceolata.AAC.1